MTLCVRKNGRHNKHGSVIWCCSSIKKVPKSLFCKTLLRAGFITCFVVTFIKMRLTNCGFTLTCILYTGLFILLIFFSVNENQRDVIRREKRNTYHTNINKHTYKKFGKVNRGETEMHINYPNESSR